MTIIPALAGRAGISGVLRLTSALVEAETLFLKEGLEGGERMNGSCDVLRDHTVAKARIVAGTVTSGTSERMWVSS